MFCEKFSLMNIFLVLKFTFRTTSVSSSAKSRMMVPDTGDVLSSSNINLLTALLFFIGCVGFSDFFGRSSTSLISTISGELLPLFGEACSAGRHVRNSSKNCLVNFSFFASGLSLSLELSSSHLRFRFLSTSSFELLSSKCLNIFGECVLFCTSGDFRFCDGGGVQGGVIGEVDFRDRSSGTNGSL